MIEIVAELEKILPLKDTTEVGDIVLIAAKEPQMLLYAHIDDIKRDSDRKDEWWHISLTMLAIPLQKTVWTLRTPQMEGREMFTMGGEERFFKAVDFGSNDTPVVLPDAGKKKAVKKGLKRIK
jgi:hypothetical protein